MCSSRQKQAWRGLADIGLQGMYGRLDSRQRLVDIGFLRRRRDAEHGPEAAMNPPVEQFQMKELR